MNKHLENLFKKDPIKFAFEIYDSQFDKENTEFITVDEGYLMYYRKFDPATIILYAEKENTAKKLLSLIAEDRFILFIEPKWSQLLNFNNIKVYPELLMVCNSPKVFNIGNVRKLSIDDKNDILNLYGEDRGKVLLNMLSEGKTTAYGLFISHLVSAAYTWIETNDVAVIGGVLTQEGFRNKGYATSVVSILTQDVIKRGKVASLYVREDNAPAIYVYKKIGFKEYEKRLWVSVNTELKPL